MSRRQGRKHGFKKSGRHGNAAVMHLLIADPTIPADHAGRVRCTYCGRMAKAGDLTHLDPDALPAAPRPLRALPPELAEQARLRDARILGEKEDD